MSRRTKSPFGWLRTLGDILFSGNRMAVVIAFVVVTILTVAYASKYCP